MSKISTYIITYNEAEKIKDAINSVLWSDEIVVVDSHSTDGTSEIAASMGAKVVQIDFKGFGDLRNQAMATCSNDWIFSLDSDERCTPEVRDEISAIIQSADTLDAYYVPRRNFFMGKRIRHSGFYPDYRQPQLFRKNILKFQNDPVHEAYEINSNKPAGFLKNAIWQVPYKNFAEIIHKMNKYSSLGAEKLDNNQRKGTMLKAFSCALWSFFTIFILKRGVLDGWAGFVIAFGNFEGTFYKYAKLHERHAHWHLPSSPPLKKK